jgi:cytochrome c-type biogenesis protein CcmH
MPADLQSQAHQRIVQQHLAEIDQSLAEGRLNAAQHAAATDDWLRQVLDDAAPAAVQAPIAAPSRILWAGLIVLLVGLTGLSYGLLGTPQSWRSVPLSQQVQIQGTTSAQWSEQTRLWQQTTQTQPDNAKAWLMLARLQAAQNEYTLAEQALGRVLALSPEPDLWLERAQLKALSADGVYAGEPWQWIEKVLREQPQHLNALVLAGSAALSEHRLPQAQDFWQRALRLVPEGSEAAQDLQKALAQLSAQASAQVSSALPANGGQAASQPSDTRPLIQGEVRLSAEVLSQWSAGATLFVYALDESGSRRPVAIWRGSPTAWPARFTLSDSMGMGAGPVLSSLSQVRLVARISQTGSAQKQKGDWQVELPGVKTGVTGVVLQISGH